MKRHAYLMLFPAILLVSSLENTFSQDWPQFRGLQRDGTVSGFKAPVSWPESLTQVWKIKIGTGDASPVEVQKKLYVHTRQGNEEVILCIDAVTGKEIWKNSYSAPSVTGAASSHPGPRSTPAVADNKVVTFGVSGILTCLDAKTGSVIWRKDNPSSDVPEFFAAASPLIYEGICFIHTGKADDGKVIALDLQTGKEKWVWKGEGPTYSTPSVMIADGEKHLIIYSDKSLLALTLNEGKLLWKMPTTLVRYYYNAASPYINGQVIYVTGQGYGSKAIRVEKQGSGYGIKELWNNPSTGAKWNTPVLKNGFLYGFTDSRRIYCINAENGNTAWTDNTVYSDFSTLVDCGNILAGLTSTGYLIFFMPDSKAFSGLSKYKVADTPVYTFPLITGNDIYIKDSENLIKYSLNR